MSSFKVPEGENSLNEVEINALAPVREAVKTLLPAVQPSGLGTRVGTRVQFLRGYRRRPHLSVRPSVRPEGLRMADITAKTKASERPAFERLSLDATQTPTIFLPFPEKNAISGGI